MENPLKDVIDRVLRKQSERENERLSLYVVACCEFVKIGIAVDVKRRIQTMQSNCPFEIKLVATCSPFDAAELEESLHAQFEQFRVRGEWFKMPDDVISDLLKIFSDPLIL